MATTRTLLHVWSLLLVFYCIAGTNCMIEKHLKKAFNKTDVSKMRNIDYIYMINLDERPEKWERSCKELEPYGIIPYRFSAVNGWKLSLEAINDVGIKFQPGMKDGYMGSTFRFDENLQINRYNELISNYGTTYFRHGMSKGAIGIVLSHLSVLKDALDSNYNTIWIMEDDIEVHTDPRKLSNLIDELDTLVGKENWDILFTDKNTRDAQGNYVPAAGMAAKPNFDPTDKSQYYICKELNENFVQVGARFGSYSMILRRGGIKKIYNFITTYKIFQPYDLEYTLPKNIKMYTVKNDIVGSFINALTDNGAPYYLVSK